MINLWKLVNLGELTDLASTDLDNGKKLILYYASWVSQRYACAFATPRNLPERSRNTSSVQTKQIRMKKKNLKGLNTRSKKLLITKPSTLKAKKVSQLNVKQLKWESGENLRNVGRAKFSFRSARRFKCRTLRARLNCFRYSDGPARTHDLPRHSPTLDQLSHRCAVQLSHWSAVCYAVAKDRPERDPFTGLCDILHALHVLFFTFLSRSRQIRDVKWLFLKFYREREHNRKFEFSFLALTLHL